MTPLAFRFAARELRSGVRGFRVFLACLALGVAAIAAAGSTAEAFRRGLAQEAQSLLGGDLSAASEKGFTEAQRRTFERLGRTAYASVTRAMAEAPSGERRMVEIRGVDDAYPLIGSVELSGPDGRPLELNQALTAGAVPGAAVEQALLDRMELKLGQTFTVADKPFLAAAVLEAEPDRLTRGFALGPRVLVRMGAYDQAGFRKSPGFEGEAVRLVLPEGRTPKQAANAIRKAFPKAGLQVRERADAAPGARRLIDQLEYFLGFIGLSSLVAGGLGVSGAVSSYLNGRRPSIATLKALGATSGLIRDLHLIQIAVLAVLGIVIGLAFGAAAPFVVGMMAGNDLPVPALFDLYPGPLLRAAAFGALAAAAFSLGPLAQARATPPASLFRRQLTGRAGFGIETVAAVLAGLGLAGLAVWTAPTREAAAVMIAGVIAAFGALWVAGRIAAWVGGRLRGMAKGPIRLGLANLAGPRSAARTAAPAMGLGVALLAAVALIQAALIREIAVVAPQAAPALVFTDIPADRAVEFDRLAAGALGTLTPDRYLRMPFTSGRIVRIRGEAVDRAAIEPAGRWAFDRDLPMAAIGGEPAGAAIEAGRWWPAGYTGPARVALEEDAAKAAEVKVGDDLTILIAGREIEAKVAVLRRVNFGSFGPSFGVIIDENTLKGANLNNVAIAKADKAQEAKALRDLAEPFPQVNVITVREQLEAALRMFDKLSLAVRAAAGVAALAGLLVLAGAIAAGARDRAREAAIFKVLGASRLQVLAAYAVEYGAVGLIAGTAGSALGAAAAWGVIEKLLRLDWRPDWQSLAAMVVGAVLAAAVGGLIAAWRALAERPAPVLRGE